MAHVALLSTDFPLYTVLSGQDGQLFVAGGGGQARTGVPNALEIYKAHGEGDDVQCTLVSRIDVGEHAIMNAALSPNQSHVAVGLDSKCRLMAVQDSRPAANKSLRRRLKSNSQLKASDDIRIEVVTERQTDFLDGGAFQKVVRFSRDGSMLATGGADSSIRVWTCPGFNPIHTLKGHLDEIDDMDFSPASRHIVSISRDQSARAWNLNSGKEEAQLAKDQAIGNGFYRFRACRYGQGKNKEFLYTTLIPVKREGRPQSFVTVWNGKTFTHVKSVKVGSDPITKLESSMDGTYVGIGTSEGTVAVYGADDLQLVSKTAGVHQSFVTGLAFFKLPLEKKSGVKEKAHREARDHEIVLLSISVDRMCQLTRITRRRSWAVLLLFLFVLVALVMFLALLIHMASRSQTA